MKYLSLFIQSWVDICEENNYSIISQDTQDISLDDAENDANDVMNASRTSTGGVYLAPTTQVRPDVPDCSEITYEVFNTGGERGSAKLVSSLGFQYGLKKQNK